MHRSAACCLSATLLASAAGCAGAPGPQVPDPPSSAAGTAGESDLETVAEPDTADLAVAILSERLSVPASEIEIVESGAIEWPDSSLGCPRPDRSYRPVITPGHYAVLRHAGSTWRVHMANGKGFVCERSPGERSAKSPVRKLALPVEQLQALARIDLAGRLGVPVEEVQPTGSRSVVWPDSSLGCAETGGSYRPTQTKGHVLTFTAHGRSYEYHADLYRAVPCPPVEPE